MQLDPTSRFSVLGEIRFIETIAEGRGIRQRGRLLARFGGQSWRKKKGLAYIKVLRSGSIYEAELHWYEAHGVGKIGLKIKRVFRRVR